MSVEVGLVPVGLDETVSQTLARATGEICVLTNRNDGKKQYLWDEPEQVDRGRFDVETVVGRDRPSGDFAGWRDEATARFRSMEIWHENEQGSWPVFWSPGVGWQVSFHDDRAMLLWRGMQAIDAGAPACTDTQLLAVFTGLPLQTLIVWTGDGFDWDNLDDQQHPITTIG